MWCQKTAFFLKFVLYKIANNIKMKRLNNNKYLSSELKGAIIGLHKQVIPRERIANPLKI